jgi:adenylate kinase family enzyme
MVETKNILLIGRTGSGKSTLANVLMDENKFKVSGKSVSATKNIEEGVFEVDLDREGREKIKGGIIAAEFLNLSLDSTIIIQKKLGIFS